MNRSIFYSIQPKLDMWLFVDFCVSPRNQHAITCQVLAESNKIWTCSYSLSCIILTLSIYHQLTAKIDPILFWNSLLYNASFCKLFNIQCSNYFCSFSSHFQLLHTPNFEQFAEICDQKRNSKKNMASYFGLIIERIRPSETSVSS